MKLRILQNTWFKQSTADSAKLAATDKVAVTTGKEFTVHSWKAVGNNHMRIALLDETLGDPERNTWFVFTPHVSLINLRGQTTPPPTPPAPSIQIPPLRLPAAKSLGVPYLSQLNNAMNPSGACNVTCFAMVMRYFKIPQRTNAVQLEDELYRYMDSKKLSRHDPGDLAEMARDYGLKNELTLQGRLSDIRKAIAEGKPCIIHGYFTSFGHIIVVRGYDRRGFRVNDPFGEWTASGYRKDLTGENLHYSNTLIQSRSSPEGPNFVWLHRLSKA
jgi:hypothetical protein